VQIRRAGDALVCGDVAGEASARIRCVVGCAQRERVIERGPPGGIGERFLCLEPQAIARHYPADPLDDPGRDQPSGGDHRQQRFAAARGDSGEDVARGGLAADDRLDHAGEVFLVRAE